MDESREEVDELGFFLHRRCPHCNAHYYNSNGKALCLNGCDLPHWQWVEMQRGLQAARVKEREDATQ